MPFRSLYIILLALLGSPLQAQDFSWWNQIHNWDGITPWTSYLIVSPGFMGPNALPVPEIRKGHLTKVRSFELALEGHYNKGDQAGDLFAELFFPLFSQRAGFAISWVPVEVYKTDTVTRDLRRSREYDPRGYHLGDIYLSTYIHLVKEKRRIPDLLMTVNLKTASGTGFDGARHTDTPGYYFDLSAGKTIYTGEHALKTMRAYAMAGFYVYQTNLLNHRQNDAFLYGAGMDLNFGRLQLEQQLGGYTGYLGNGDKPIVYRLNLIWYSQAGPPIKLRFQHGFRDFPYSSLRLSTVLNF